MNGIRDIEKLSAYLDGQLSPSDSIKLEARLKTDPELASAYNDIRFARGILRKLPARKAPRNFMLTRKMVGLKPPLPRTYSFFRFSSAFATLLLMFTFAFNAISPRLAVVPAPFGSGGGCTGGCGGGGPASDTALELQAPSVAATEAPAAAEMLPADAADAERSTETPSPKEPEAELAQQAPGQNEAVLIPVIWQVVLLVVGAAGGLILFLMNQSAKRKWK